MQFDDISTDSGSGFEESGSNDIDKALNYAKEQEKEEQEQKQKQKEEEEKKQQEEDLKRLQEEAQNIQLSPEEQERMEQNKRAAHNQKLVQNFLKDDDDDLPVKTGPKSNMRRDYTEEDAFMAVEVVKQPQSTSSGKSGIPDELKTYEDYNRCADHFATEIAKKYVSGLKNNNQLYVQMLKRLIRGALEPTQPESAKEIVEDLIKYANERIQDKSKKKGKKSTKTHFNQRVDASDKKRIQNQMNDDDDDFM